MKKKQRPKPPAQKRPVGRPPELVVKIDDTPENVARTAFGMKRKPVSRKDSDKQDG